MARNHSLGVVIGTLFFLWSLTFSSTEAGLLDTQECISGDNYCYRSDVCAYVFTFNASEDGTCPRLDRLVSKVDHIQADVELLELKLRQAKTETALVREERESMRDLISGQNDIIEVLEGRIRRNSEVNDQLLDRLSSVTIEMEGLEKKLIDRDARITELRDALSKLGPFFGPPALALVTTNTKVVVTERIPDLSAVTACIWVKITETGHDASLVSYAVPGHDNEFLIHYYGNGFNVFVDNLLQAIVIPPIDDKEWHHVCITWSSSDGEWKYYHNGVFNTGDTGYKTGATINGGGFLILGQEQDSVGGSFDANQALVGSLTEFHMWSRVLSDDEIADVAGGDSIGGGDVFTWSIDKLNIEGDVALTTSANFVHRTLGDLEN